MQFKNTEHTYGLVAILLHWSFALSFITLFAIGVYMVELVYTDPLYKSLPDFHRSLGLVLTAVFAFRLIWRFINPHPLPEPNLKPYEIRISSLVHGALYLLPFLIFVSGYLITTADGSSISVFGLFDVPALFPAQKGREEIAGDIHFILAYLAIGIVVLHGLAALKHHFIDQDRTLVKMIKITSK